jgi:hypothetical protein
MLHSLTDSVFVLAQSAHWQLGDTLHVKRREQSAASTCAQSTVPLSIVPPHDAASMPPELPLLLPELPDELPLLDPLLLPELLPLLDDPASDPLPVEDDDEHAAMLRHPSPATNTTLKRLFLTATSLQDEVSMIAFYGGARNPNVAGPCSLLSRMFSRTSGGGCWSCAAPGAGRSNRPRNTCAGACATTEPPSWAAGT